MLIPYCNFFIFQTHLINKTFTFKLLLFGDKFDLAGNILACLKLSANITIHNVITGIINEPYKLTSSTSWNLCISTLEPESSSLFWLHTSVNVVSERPASRSVDSTSLFLAKNCVWRFCFILEHRDHLKS